MALALRSTELMSSLWWFYLLEFTWKAMLALLMFRQDHNQLQLFKSLAHLPPTSWHSFDEPIDQFAQRNDSRSLASIRSKIWISSLTAYLNEDEEEYQSG